MNNIERGIKERIRLDICETGKIPSEVKVSKHEFAYLWYTDKIEWSDQEVYGNAIPFYKGIFLEVEEVPKG